MRSAASKMVPSDIHLLIHALWRILTWSVTYGFSSMDQRMSDVEDIIPRLDCKEIMTSSLSILSNFWGGRVPCWESPVEEPM